MSFLGFTSTRLGLRSVLPKNTPTKKPEDPVRLQLRPLDYVSNILPLSHAGPLRNIRKKFLYNNGTDYDVDVKDDNEEKKDCECMSMTIRVPTALHILCHL